MKRRVTQIILFLLLGAIVNIVVAWGSVIWIPSPQWSYDAAIRELPVKPPADWRPLDKRTIDWSPLYSNDVFIPEDASSPGSHPSTRIRLEVLRAGFPLRCFSCISASDQRLWDITYYDNVPNPGPYPRTLPTLSTAQQGLPVPDSLHWQNGTVRIPILPHWIGIIINSIVYALLVHYLGRCGLHLRGRLRLRTGHCPYCAYDLQHESHTGCPECGWHR
jgi:hypothetical protein